jgi:hypothetical protein
MAQQFCFTLNCSTELAFLPFKILRFGEVSNSRGQLSDVRAAKEVESKGMLLILYPINR